MATNTRRTTVTRAAKAATSSKNVPKTQADQLADDLSRKLTLNNTNVRSGRTASSRVPSGSRTSGGRNGKVAKTSLPVVEEKSPEQVKFDSMRAVNAASQVLSGVVQSGWKRSSAAPTVASDKNTLLTVQKAATDAAQHLATLRNLIGVATSSTSSNDLDIERAAGSVLAKLVALEMFDAAQKASEEMHPRLCALLGESAPQPSDPTKLYLLSLPIPTSSPKSSAPLLNLVSTYLSCAVTLASLPQHQPSSKNTPHEWVDNLATYLNSPSTHSLLNWIPYFQQCDALPTKHVDSLLTRAYTTLTKFCTSLSSPPPGISKLSPRDRRTSTASLPKPSSSDSSRIPRPSSVFAIRNYALKCLCKSSTGIIEPKSFWDQAMKFAGAYVKSGCSASAESKGKGIEVEQTTLAGVLAAFDGLYALAVQRQDNGTFLDVDGGFGSFCDYWSEFAKRAGDILLLQKVQSLQDPSSPTSARLDPTKPPAPLQGPTHTEDAAGDPSSSNQQTLHPSKNSNASTISLGTKLANSLTRLSVVLQNRLDGDKGKAVEQLPSAVQETSDLLTESITSGLIGQLLIPSQTSNSMSGEGEEVDRVAKVAAKVDRAFERVRRLGLKVIEVGDASEFTDTTRALLLHCVEAFATSSSFDTSTTPQANILDVLTRLLDTVFVLSKTRLNVQDPLTFIPTFELLVRGKTALEGIASRLGSSTVANEGAPGLEVANLTRCISGAFYNHAGALYQGMRYGNAVAFLKEGCVLGRRALHRRYVCLKTCDDDSMKERMLGIKGAGRLEDWSQLEDQLFRRWELLAICYMKAGDRRQAYDAYKHAILAFPFVSSGLSQRIETMAPDAVFNPSPAKEAHCNPQLIKQLVGLIDKVTYIGTCELFLSPYDVSLRSSTTNHVPRSPKRQRKQSSSIVGEQDPASSLDLPADIIGILLERQLDSLESSRWKEGVKGVYVRLLQDCLDVYDHKQDGMYRTPIRRARMIVRCLEFTYREGAGDEELGFGGPASSEVMQAEIETLCTAEMLHDDTRMSRYGSQYRIAANLWVALHAHKRCDEAQNTIMTMRSEETCRLIQELLSTSPEKNVRNPYATRPVQSPKVARKTIISPARPGVQRSTPRVAIIVSPPRTRMTRAANVPAAPKKTAPAKKSTTRGKREPPARSAVPPATPKSKVRSSEETFKTPPRFSSGGPLPTRSPFVFDKFDELLSLLQLVARILGILSLILAKAHLLDMTRKLAQRHVGTASDGFVLASVDLAHEYVTLGKLKRAAAIFKPALEVVHGGQASPEVSVRLLLRFAEHLAAFEDVPKSAQAYNDALDEWKSLDLEQKGSSTLQRILSRTKVLEITATAAHVFGVILHTNADACASLDAFLRSLRLWNRAIDALSRLRPPQPGTSERDPFEMSSLKDALPASTSSETKSSKSKRPGSFVGSAMDGIEWRLFEGTLSTLFSLSELYFLRGSAREAEFFAKQAADLAEQLNAPAMLSRALTRQAELQLKMGKSTEARETLRQAAALVQDMPGLDQAEVRRLDVDWKIKQEDRQNGVKDSDKDDPGNMFEGTLMMLNELDQAFLHFDKIAFGPRRSIGTSPGVVQGLDVLAPALLSTVLSQQLWLLRDEVGDDFNSILERYLSLSLSKRTKADEYVLLAKLAIHAIHGRFQSDMFLSSLTESTIASPMGLALMDGNQPNLPAKDILESLGRAERHLWDHLGLSGNTGNTIKLREVIVHLVKIGVFRTSLGDRSADLPLMATLLDSSVALSLQRDMIEAIHRKLGSPAVEDLHWPSLSEVGCPVPLKVDSLPGGIASSSDTEDDDDDDLVTQSKDDKMLRRYWTSIREKYNFHPSILPSKPTVRNSTLPSDWIVINMTLSPDESSLFVCRCEGGPDNSNQLLFCIPLKGRREDEDHLTYSGAMEEFRDIIQSSDECTKAAAKIKNDDLDARTAWWTQRRQLDTRLRELLENIEYCWLGAFKTILSPRSDVSLDIIEDLRIRIERIFHTSLRIKEKKHKKTPRKRNTLEPQSFTPSQFQLDNHLIRCFSSLSPKCKDEELEDLIYFVLDLYQLHGVPVAIAEVDIDQMIVDLRTVFEEHAAKRTKQRGNSSKAQCDNEHAFLVLDKNLQGLPWESLPILRGRSVSRVPGLQFLYDRLDFAKCKREAAGQTFDNPSGAVVDPRRGYFILNPSGDLIGTEARFRDWAKGMQSVGWDGTIGEPVSEQQFVNALKTHDLVVYFGHNGGEQFVRSHQIRNLPVCAATMLWGCSSGTLKEMGDFDRVGTPYNYMIAGCPTLVANLWDVTDKDIDKITSAVFDKLSLHGDAINSTARQSTSRKSLVAAVAESRDSCKLKYLTGAAPVVYGIPFYL